MDIREIHQPVLAQRCLDLMAPALETDGPVSLDATLGMGGHAEALLERVPSVRLVGLDRDAQALEIARQRLDRFTGRIILVHTVYDDLPAALETAGVGEIHAALFDLGVSSLQLDDPERGFSYARDAPLDMRMDTTAGKTAADILAGASEGELRRIFEWYGEEKLAGRYARAIIAERQQTPLTRSADLVRVLEEATPRALARDGHPAKRVFQALRIEVNDELGSLRRAIPAALDALAVGGRLVVMAYQSLEDRFVKRTFAEATSSSAPAGLPVEPAAFAPRFRLLTKGAERASDAEIAENSRAKPVRLRAIERIAPGEPA